MESNSVKNKHPFLKYLREQWDAPFEDVDDPERKGRIWKGIQTAIGAKRSLIFLSRLKVVSAVAASLVLVFLGGYSIWKHSSAGAGDKEYVWIASSGEMQILPDGTKVWMEKGCTMTFHDDFSSSRQVWLQGNATFDVISKGGQNFIVNLNDSYVEVKGTCFSIRQDNPSKVSVSLYEGKVDFVSTKTDNVVTLKPSQSIVYNLDDASILVNEFSQGISWSDGSYKLDKVDLIRLTEFLSTKYNVTFDCSAVRRSGKTLTGVIGHDESFDKVLEKICYVFDIDYRSEDNVYSLID